MQLETALTIQTNHRRAHLELATLLTELGDTNRAWNHRERASADTLDSPMESREPGTKKGVGP